MSRFDELDGLISTAVKLQRENGDTAGALELLRDVINKAVSCYTEKASYESFQRCLTVEKAFDKARLVYQRSKQSAMAVASGMVAYFMTIKRLSASAELCASKAVELRSPQNPLLLQRIETKRTLEQSAKFEERMAKDELAKACAAMADAAILNEASRLLKKMKMDASLARKILVAVYEPQDNPLEMFNAVLSAIS